MAACWALTRKRHKYAGIKHNKKVQAAVWAPSKSVVNSVFVSELDKGWGGRPHRALGGRNARGRAKHVATSPGAPGAARVPQSAGAGPLPPCRPPPRPPPGGAAGCPALGSPPGALARASGGGRPGGGHGPLRVDQRPPGDQRDPGDPAARSAHLRRRGEGRAAAGLASLPDPDSRARPRRSAPPPQSTPAQRPAPARLGNGSGRARRAEAPFPPGVRPLREARRARTGNPDSSPRSQRAGDGQAGSAFVRRPPGPALRTGRDFGRWDLGEPEGLGGPGRSGRGVALKGFPKRGVSLSWDSLAVGSVFCLFFL